MIIDTFHAYLEVFCLRCIIINLSLTTAGLILAFENYHSTKRLPYKGCLSIRWFPAQGHLSSALEFFGTCSVKLNPSPVLDMPKHSLDWNLIQGPYVHSDIHTLDHHDHLMMSQLSINQSKDGFV